MKKDDSQKQKISFKKEGYALVGSSKFFTTLKAALKFAKDNGLDPKSYYRTSQG